MRLVPLLLLCLACGSRATERPSPRPRPVVEVGWPVSRDVPLERVLLDVASPVAPPRAPGAPPLTETADPDQAGEPLPDGVEGVQAREHRVAGLYVLEVVLGHVAFDAELPLVVMLHGRGDRPRVPGGPFAGAPTPMRLLLPRAPKPLGSGFTWLPLSVTENRADVMADTLRRRADQLAQVIAHFRALRPSQGKVIVAGFSQGAMLTYSLALLHPEHVDVALPIAGWLPAPLVPAEVPPVRRVPIRAIHGDADPVVRIEPTRQLVARLRELGYDVEWVEESGTAHVVSPTMNAQFERWLEASLERLAPGLATMGQGLGEVGAEVVTYAPWIALDPPTVEAIQAAEQEAAASEAAGETPRALQENGSPTSPSDPPNDETEPSDPSDDDPSEPSTNGATSGGATSSGATSDGTSGATSGATSDGTPGATNEPPTTGGSTDARTTQATSAGSAADFVTNLELTSPDESEVIGLRVAVHERPSAELAPRASDRGEGFGSGLLFGVRVVRDDAGAAIAVTSGGGPAVRLPRFRAPLDAWVFEDGRWVATVPLDRAPSRPGSSNESSAFPHTWPAGHVVVVVERAGARAHRVGAGWTIAIEP